MNMNKPIVIGIAGGTGSGKTSVVSEILKKISSSKTILLEQDSYYKHSTKPYEERIKENYDHPNSIDFNLLISHIKDLMNGVEIKRPNYSFIDYNREDGYTLIKPQPIIIVEGILILSNEKLRRLFDMKIFVDTDSDERLLRRIERDIKERGRTLESVKKQYMETVKPMHLEFVEPSKRYADVIIPRGRENIVAIDMVSTRLQNLLEKE